MPRRNDVALWWLFDAVFAGLRGAAVVLMLMAVKPPRCITHADRLRST